jgi:hypothetical protein
VEASIRLTTSNSSSSFTRNAQLQRCKYSSRDRVRQSAYGLSDRRGPLRPGSLAAGHRRPHHPTEKADDQQKDANAAD